MLALEEETNLNLFRYGKEIAFLRQLILEGQWEDVENFLKPAQIRAKIDFNSLLFEIRKQRYLELLETQQLDQHVLVTALKELEGFCSKEVYNGLCYLLTLERLIDHPDFNNWTVQKGRLQCFESIKTCLSNIYQTQEKRRAPLNRLAKLLKDSIIYQYFIAKQTGTMTKFKFDPISQSSEVSLLRDLINQDNQSKFNKANLSEVKISFYNRNQKLQNQNINQQYQTLEQPDDQIQEDIEDDDDIDEEDSQSEYYENELAQSMPAHIQTKAAQKQNKPIPNMLAQSINHNAFTKIPQSSNENRAMSQMQQQMTNDKTYKSIQYHKSRQSYDQNQPDILNSSQASKKQAQLQNVIRAQQPVAYSTNFEFQRQNNPNISQINENNNELQLQGSQVNRSMVQQHSRSGSKSSQNSGFQAAFNQMSIDKKGNQQYKQVYQYQPDTDPTSRRQIQHQNFIFQNDSEQDDRQEESKATSNYSVVNRNQPKQQMQTSNRKLTNNHQELEEEEEEYEDDFNQQQDQEDERQDQQESVRQIYPDKSYQQLQQSQQLQNQNMQQNYNIDTEENPQQIISDIEPSIESTVANLTQRAILIDSQPIRTACFSPRGEHLALGTNSKSLKICALPNFQQDEEDDDEELSPNEQYLKKQNSQQIQVVFEQQNHHNGSLYCVDWSRTSRLIASGSNDKTIKLLVCPDFDQNEHNELLEMVLEGHSAIVRTLCFNPTNDLILLSGGLVDKEIKVWDSETGKNVANLKGHQGDVYSIKMSTDGSYAFSVGKDKFIHIWDVRSKQSVYSIDGTSYSDMNDICLTSSPAMQSMNKANSTSFNGLACVAHFDGSLTYWDLNMRKCLAVQNVHKAEARGVTSSVDGKYLASAGFDSQIIITDTSDLDNLIPVKTLHHEDKVVSVKWHPFLPLLLSTSADKTARIWYPQMHQ